MLVNWKADHMNVVSLVDSTYTGPLVGKDTVEVLMPGWNEVPDTAWDLMYPQMKQYIEQEKLEFYCTKKTEDGVTTFTGQPLRDVRADKAREIVKGCFNVANLKTWQDDMKITTEIRHLIDRQVEQIEKYGEDQTRSMRF